MQYCHGAGRIKQHKRYRKNPSGVDEGDRIVCPVKAKPASTAATRRPVCGDSPESARRIPARHNDCIAKCDQLHHRALGAKSKSPPWMQRQDQIPAETQTGKVFRLRARHQRRAQFNARDLLCIWSWKRQ